jgi:hypothetical protein
VNDVDNYSNLLCSKLITAVKVLFHRLLGNNFDHGNAFKSFYPILKYFGWMVFFLISIAHQKRNKFVVNDTLGILKSQPVPFKMI